VEPLRFPGFRAWLAGRAINALGNSIAPIALAFVVLDISHAARDLGLVVGSRTLVNVLFVLFGGVLADRLPKRGLMIGASISSGVSQAVVAMMALTHTATIPSLLALGAFNGMASAVSFPASSAILPQIVPADIRQQANALARLSLNSASIVGAPVGGILAASAGPAWGIGLDAATFFLGAFCFAFIKPPPRKEASPKINQSITLDLHTGWKEFWTRKWLWAVVAGFCMINAALVGGMSVLGPMVADETTGRHLWGFVLAAETGGMIIGAIVAMRLRIRRLLLFGVAMTAFGAVPLFVLGTRPLFLPLVAAGFIAGLSIQQFGIAWETTMQEHVPSDKLARVYSYDMLGSLMAVPIGQISVGPLAEIFGVGDTLIALSALVICSVAGMLASGDVRRLEHRLPKSSSC
jgi:MFS family permease